MEIKRLYVRNGDFALYKVECKYIISVLFSPLRIMDYSRDFYVSEEELPNIDNYESLKYLSDKIRNNYETYKNKEVNKETSRILAHWISEHPRYLMSSQASIDSFMQRVKDKVERKAPFGTLK